MRRALMVLFALILAVGALWAANFGAQADPLSLLDKDGNTISVINKSQNGTTAVEVLSSNRYGGVNWDRLHQDGNLEIANAVSLDASNNVYIAGSRLWQGVKYFWVVKFSARGDLIWERAEFGHPNCSAFRVAANEQGDVWVSGGCVLGNSYPVVTDRFEALGGTTLWVSTYNGGGRNYVRGLVLDTADRATVSIEVGLGNYAGAKNPVRSIVYEQNGNQITSY